MILQQSALQELRDCGAGLRIDVNQMPFLSEGVTRGLEQFGHSERGAGSSMMA